MNPDKNRKNQFNDVILSSGISCYQDGIIDHIEKTGDGWNAIAHGTRDYLVQIREDNRIITGMSCTCPYGKDGTHCKHMHA